MKQSDSIAQLAAALVAAQAELKAIPKDSKNPHFGNRYTSLEAITETVRPVLAKHGLAVVQGATVPHTDAEGVLKALTVETMLVHSTGEWLANAMILPVGTTPIKNERKEIIGHEPTAQTAGSATSYGRRYGLSALLALTSDEDDDGEAASKAPRARQTKAAPKAKTNGEGQPSLASPEQRQTLEDLAIALGGEEEKAIVAELAKPNLGANRAAALIKAASDKEKKLAGVNR